MDRCGDIEQGSGPGLLRSVVDNTQQQLEKCDWNWKNLELQEMVRFWFDLSSWDFSVVVWKCLELEVPQCFWSKWSFIHLKQLSAINVMLRRHKLSRICIIEYETRCTVLQFSVLHTPVKLSSVSIEEHLMFSFSHWLNHSNELLLVKFLLFHENNYPWIGPLTQALCPSPPYLIYVQFQSETSLLCCTMSGSNIGVIRSDTFEADTESEETLCCTS